MDDIQIKTVVTPPSISARDLTAGYEHSAVLEKVNLSLESGGLTAIAGLNGEGKSTLLRTLVGLQKPLSGNVDINGQDLNHMPLSLMSKSVAVVLTGRFGGFNITVKDAVASGRMPYTDAFHRMGEKDSQVILQAMDQCGIASIKDLPVDRLSDGMFQKTMIARAIAQDTGILALDEPTAFLDFRSKHELFTLLSEMAKSKCILVSSHDLDLVLKYCTQVVIVANRTAQKMPVTSARTNPLFVEIAGGYL
jgi:iron complex transport system ATP-binding protein